MKTLEEIRSVNSRNQQDLLNIPGVTAVGVGYLSETDTEGDVGILVYVAADKPDVKSGIPSQIDGVPVAVRSGMFRSPNYDRIDQESRQNPPEGYSAPASVERALDNPRDKKINPMIGGISGNPDFWYVSPWTGTIGLVIKNQAGNPTILSNRHVICGKVPKVGDGVSQPSRTLIGDLAASLVQWQLGDVNYNGKNYGVDAAIATPTNGRSASIGKVYGLNDVTGAADPTLGLKVTKSGLTTSVTVGKITGIDISANDGHGVQMSNQFVIKALDYPNEFSEGGDSGSGIIDISNDVVVGLLWGGNDLTHETVASPIRPILNLFNCTIV